MPYVRDMLVNVAHLHTDFTLPSNPFGPTAKRIGDLVIFNLISYATSAFFYLYGDKR